jgi:hypothetical protein
MIENPLLIARESLKYFMVKFLNQKWLPHYNDWEIIAIHDRHALIQAPRGHGKSTFWSFAVPLWDVIRGEADVVLISYSEDQVKRLIRNIRMEVESNPYLEQLRPSTKELWGMEELWFADGGHIKGLGFGTSSRGLHPKRIVVDDPLKDLGGMSDEDQERAYFGVITGMEMSSTQTVTVGTPVSYGDLLEKLEAVNLYTKWKKPAIDDNGKPLCPELFSNEILSQRKEIMGSINFAREYLLQRIDPATQPFKRDYETFYSEVPPNLARTVTVCDPAYSEKDGDATAIVTVSFTHGNHAYVRDAREIRKDDPGAVVNELFKVIGAYEPDAVGIERRKGEAISYSFEERRTREGRWDFQYVELSHGGISKGDRMNKVGGLIPRWEARAVHVHKSQERLLQELYAFRFDDLTKGHDDLVDALAYCFHPDMARPNTGKRFVPTPENSRVGKSFYSLGQKGFQSADAKRLIGVAA